MIKRHYWLNSIEQAWTERPIVWLAGVRRVGKTCLCRSLDQSEYFDCELPSVRRLFDDSEDFFKELRGKRIVVDEIHRLANPSEFLKIAADHHPDVRILATGSSTLAATAKFRDSLAGRKRGLRLFPMIHCDLVDFGRQGWSHRLLQGGLPPFFLAKDFPERDFQEWVDAYWAKDIQDLFRLERRSSFLRLLEMILAQSGGIFEATRFSRACEVSRQTIVNYLGVLETTLVAHVIRPFSQHRPSEIVAAPKVYGFDTGFVCAFRGWTSLRPEDSGLLWEHLVLNEIQAHRQGDKINYWRNKQGHEVDFILAPAGQPPMAIECKWSEKDFDPRNLQAFRGHYPDGINLLVAHNVAHPHTRHYGKLAVRHVDVPGLVAILGGTKPVF